MLVQIVHTTKINFNCIILVLGTYLFPVNYISKQNWVARLVMRKQHTLKVRRYVAHMIKIDFYFDILLVLDADNLISDTELN